MRNLNFCNEKEIAAHSLSSYRHQLSYDRCHVLFSKMKDCFSSFRPRLVYVIGFLSYFGWSDLPDVYIYLDLPGCSNASIEIRSSYVDDVALPFCVHFWKYAHMQHFECSYRYASLDDISDGEIISLADRWFFPEKYDRRFVQLSLF